MVFTNIQVYITMSIKLSNNFSLKNSVSSVSPGQVYVQYLQSYVQSIYRFIGYPGAWLIVSFTYLHMYIFTYLHIQIFTYFLIVLMPCKYFLSFLNCCSILEICQKLQRQTLPRWTFHQEILPLQ